MTIHASTTPGLTTTDFASTMPPNLMDQDIVRTSSYHLPPQYCTIGMPAASAPLYPSPTPPPAADVTFAVGAGRRRFRIPVSLLSGTPNLITRLNLQSSSEEVYLNNVSPAVFAGVERWFKERTLPNFSQEEEQALENLARRFEMHDLIADITAMRRARVDAMRRPRVAESQAVVGTPARVARSANKRFCERLKNDILAMQNEPIVEDLRRSLAVRSSWLQRLGVKPTRWGIFFDLPGTPCVLTTQGFQCYQTPRVSGDLPSVTHLKKEHFYQIGSHDAYMQALDRELTKFSDPNALEAAVGLYYRR